MKTVDPLHGVAVFLAVARHESFTAAADAMGLTRSIVSAQVADLEARLGLRLFHRSTRLVRLTPAGQVCRARLDDLSERVATAERAARAEHAAPEGRLRISAPPDFGQRYLVGRVTEFLEEHPGMRIELDLSNVAGNLIERRFDLAICGTLEVAPPLIARKLGASPLLLCAGPGYLARRGPFRTPSDLAGHDILHFSALRTGWIRPLMRGADRIDVRSRRGCNRTRAGRFGWRPRQAPASASCRASWWATRCGRVLWCLSFPTGARARFRCMRSIPTIA
ncbi:DNA-binding transcriptional LysR family regulator [Rhodovulum kholense]|uniref:DNA-binding transcriptional LysR family regulator n=1 Tax=Rhodovulum kholense TaxID=453584 RepID=A0A8E2VHA9_9RHOB|nr:LysR substrate-binding domain-containing protein [Rhodovulum kholense]PTW45284.1 DNA-binding transcriptional LysR family regulator [Rhodovulum kholense]